VKQIAVEKSAADNDPASQVLKAFQLKNPLPWNQFTDVIQNVFGLAKEKTQELGFILNTRGVVEKTVWIELMKWFTPLVVFDNYHVKQDQQVLPVNMAFGYSIEEVVDIVKPKWFYGFLSTNDAKRILTNKGNGSFLFRFSSSSPGYYTLSVCYSGGIGHWRINSEKKSNCTIFKIDEVKYRSLYDIVDTHSIKPLWSNVVSDLQTELILLKQPTDRDKDL